jgi:hypothetical protein
MFFTDSISTRKTGQQDDKFSAATRLTFGPDGTVKAFNGQFTKRQSQTGTTLFSFRTIDRSGIAIKNSSQFVRGDAVTAVTDAQSHKTVFFRKVGWNFHVDWDTGSVSFISLNAVAG